MICRVWRDWVRALYHSIKPLALYRREIMAAELRSYANTYLRFPMKSGTSFLNADQIRRSRPPNTGGNGSTS